MPACECAQKPELFPADDAHPHLRRMAAVAHQDQWVRLLCCQSCAQHWQVDAWDKYRSGLAIKLSSPDSWAEFDDVPTRMQALVQARGGLGKEHCQWAGCANRAIHGLAYCPGCAYHQVGIRE